MAAIGNGKAYIDVGGSFATRLAPMHIQTLTRSHQLLSERVATPVLLTEIDSLSQEPGRAAPGAQ